LREPNRGIGNKTRRRGSEISGEESQRIEVARAIIRKPQFVILDEASSAVVSKTKKEMEGNLKQICEGRTYMVVAHRI